MTPSLLSRLFPCRVARACALTLGTLAVLDAAASAAPKVILISLDGATPRLVEQYVSNGALAPNTGLRLLEAKGVKALQNLTINPSLTAAAHIAIATGSNAAANDIPGNAYRLLATPMTAPNTTSGFGGPIGGYQLNPLAMSPMVTAIPIWNTLRAAPYNKVVVTATWPGGDGVNVTAPGVAGSPILQPASERTVDYTVPFGAGAAPFQKGFPLTAADFSTDVTATVGPLLSAAGKTFDATTPIRQAALETFTAGGQTYLIRAAAYDTTSDATVNYDSIVIFREEAGVPTIAPGPFALPSTGPSYIKPSADISALFYLEGHTNKAGVRYFVSNLQPDLSVVRLARSTSAFIPRNAAVLGDVDDINNNVGFWQPQPDFRIVEKLDAVPSTFATFPDLELEAIYGELVAEFTEYQKNIVLRALAQKPNADLSMFYFEQPDGSGHQFLLTDPRQPTDFTNPNSILAGQDPVKKARYAQYLQNAYVTANNAVQAVINAVGVDGNGVPNSNIIVTSDHGFETFHTAINVSNLLTTSGIDLNKVRVVTTGPAVNVYIRLTGRSPGGAISKTEYLTLQSQIAAILRNYKDVNATYNPGGAVSIFDQVISRPLPADINDASFGLRTSEFIGQDSGDVFATLVPGYNFDGAQNPLITRQGDAANNVFSLPNFYGAHGYDPMLPNMSAIFYAAGPNISQSANPIPIMANMDIAPTIERILGVPPAATVQGRALRLGPVSNSLLRAVSRKAHAAASHDVVLPVTGPVGIESRKGGAGNSHDVVFIFANNVVSGSAAITSGPGSVSNVAFNGPEMVVRLTGVADVQNVTVTLTNVIDADGGADVVNAALSMSFLLGDVNGDRTVNSDDVSEVKSLGFASPAVNRRNARADVNVNGTINASDIALTKSRIGSTLP